MIARAGGVFVFILALGAIIGGAPAVAQQYPPPASVDDSCFVVRGRVGDEFVVGKADQGGALRAEGSEACAAPHGKVDVSIDGALLGTVTAHEDGSFLGTFTLPTSVGPGPHTVVGDIEGRGEVRRSLEVIGASVLGVSETRTSAGGGALPRTGGDILLLILWALILIALGTMLAVAARRYLRERIPVHALNGQVSRSTDVPFIDTARFMPLPAGSVRSNGHDAHRDTLIEWDVQQRQNQT